MTAVPMIRAEELCVDWKCVRAQAPTNPDLRSRNGAAVTSPVAGFPY